MIGNPIYGKIKNVPNHQPASIWAKHLPGFCHCLLFTQHAPMQSSLDSLGGCLVFQRFTGWTLWLWPKIKYKNQTKKNRTVEVPLSFYSRIWYHTHMYDIVCVIYIYTHVTIWAFPEIGVPPNHQLFMEIFPHKPTIYGYPHGLESPIYHLIPWNPIAVIASSQPSGRLLTCAPRLRKAADLGLFQWWTQEYMVHTSWSHLITYGKFRFLQAKHHTL